MTDQYWSWLLSIVGVAGFILAGKKIWWAWYINIACQGLWFTYAIVTEQWGFLFGGVIYTAVFVNNAYEWTVEHRHQKFLGARPRPIGRVEKFRENEEGIFVTFKIDDENIKEGLRKAASMPFYIDHQD